MMTQQVEPISPDILSIPPAPSAPVLEGFPPVVDRHTHTLILGSFPGEASLQAQQYYAFKQNQFWRLLSGVLSTDLVPLSYAERLTHLQTCGIGLWDVFRCCVRQGSLDSAIRQGQLNDFASLQQQYPAIKRLCFNGKTAAKIEHYFQQRGYQTRVLPSSSPAYAQMHFAEKLIIWRGLLDQNTASPNPFSPSGD